MSATPAPEVHEHTRHEVVDITEVVTDDSLTVTFHVSDLQKNDSQNLQTLTHVMAEVTNEYYAKLQQIAAYTQFMTFMSHLVNPRPDNPDDEDGQGGGNADTSV